MKNTLFFIALFILTASLNAGTIEKTYYFKDVKTQQSGDYHLISFENTFLTGKTGEPTLPYNAIKLVLPQGEIAKYIEFVGEDEIQIPGYFNIYPSQESRPLSDNSPSNFIINEGVYNENSPYPENPVGELLTEYMNGYAIGLSSFTPLKYNPVTGIVSYFRKVRIIITTAPDPVSVAALQNLSSLDYTNERVRKFVQNPDLISQYPSKDGKSDDYQLLIITPSQFQNNFQGITDVYLEKGIKTEIITTEYIFANITGQDNQEKIRNLIIQEYQAHSLEYVLLGGDVEHVPYRGFYCHVQSSSVYEDDDIPADLYYSALDGNWNDDGDNLWGEPGEDDLLPDVAVGRFSFSDATELTHMINKTISYQNNPVLGELRDPLLAGENLWSGPDTWGADYLDLLIGHHEDNGYTTDGIPVDQNIETMYERDASWSGSDLIAKINSGKQFIHHVGHANATYVAHLYNSDITDANFYNANGIDHNFTIMQTHGCICGSFDYSDCILERMVSIQNFAVAVIGNSRYGWFNEGQTEGPAAHLHREMVDALYHKKMNHIGAAFMESKIQTAPWVTAPGQYEEGALRWNFYDINILGDPVLPVWTDEPITIQANYQTTIPVGVPSTSISVTSNGSPMENFACVIIKDGVLCGVGYTDASGNAQINFDPVFSTLGNAEIIVSGYNCLATSFPVTIVPNNGSYVIYSSHIIDDSQGNNNGEADFGEAVNLSIEVENAGSAQANNVQVTLSTTDTYVVIADDYEDYGNIPGSTTASIFNGFSFDVADNIPDQHEINFDIEITSDSKETWTSNFSIVVNAPVLEFGNLVIDDNVGGNGNGRLDPGETADIIVPVANNGHSLSPIAGANLSSLSSYISINTGSTSLGQIVAGNTVEALFNISCDPLTPIGTAVDLTVDVTSGNYGISNTFYQTIGLVLEDWETGSFSSYAWTFSGTADWFITEISPYEGTYCSQSGDVSDSQTSEMEVELYVTSADNISFYRKVSSESSYDYLRFYIDGNQQDQWSGEIAWSQVSYPVTTGLHTFKWTYYKDSSVSSGSDCGWVDYIVFPPVSPPPAPPDIEINPDYLEVTLPMDNQTVKTIAISNIGESDLGFSIIKNYQTDKSPKAYCSSVGGGGDEFIQNVTIGTIDNTTTQSNYADYTSMSTVVVPGMSYPITITNGDQNWSSDECGIWVDWNQNEDFSDDAPIVVTGTPGVGPYTANIVPPVDAMPGPTRMRVQIIYSATPDPCLASFSYGEVEDYTLIVESDFSDWLTFDPIAGTIPGMGTTDIEITFNSTGMGEGDYYADLKISSNDPVEPEVIIPCTLHVGDAGIDVSLSVLLEGPYSGSTMNTSLNTAGYLPLTQPYNVAPWNYPGTESVSSIPNSNVVDWVLVELRETSGGASTATPSTMIDRQAGFVLNNGTIINIDGASPLRFTVEITENLFVVVYHRNHLGIMTANAVTLSGGEYIYDFTTGEGQVYGGPNAHKEIATGVWGMVSGDADANGEIDNKDKNDFWKAQYGNVGYLSGDFDMNGIVGTADKTGKWEDNAGNCSQIVK